MTTNPTEELAGFAAGLGFDSLSAAARERALALLIDALACAHLGRTGPETERMEGLAADISGAGDSTVIGSAHRQTVAGATLINSYQITAFNLCDVYRPAHCHLSPVVVAPALAAAEQLGVSGQHLLTAVAAGFEVASRVGSALDYPTFRANNWHSPGVIGPFGGAAAVGVLHELDATSMRNALGLAGSQSGGTMAQWGTPTIKLHQSRGAMSGLMAGLLAARGYEAGANVLASAEGGILENFSGGGSPKKLTAGLGEHWELTNISMKRWPSGSGLQTTVSALFDLIATHDIKPEAIEQVRLTLPPHSYESHGEMAWDGKFKAMLSARFITSVILHDRSCWVEQFEDARRLDPEVDRFARDRVVVNADGSLASSAARTEILLTDGSVLEDVREVPKGDPTDPLSLTEITEKYHQATSARASYDSIDRLLGIAGVDDVTPLIRSLS